MVQEEVDQGLPEEAGERGVLRMTLCCVRSASYQMPFLELQDWDQEGEEDFQEEEEDSQEEEDLGCQASPSQLIKMLNRTWKMSSSLILTLSIDFSSDS